jgi:hypothetical protein
MTSDESVRDELLAATRARLDRLRTELEGRRRLLAGDRPDSAIHTSGQARSAALASAVLALQYARDTVNRVVGTLDADAAAAVAAALGGPVETAPWPWGDSALHDRITERSARLLADIWMIGRLTAAVDPQSWSTDALVQQCLRVVSETHLAGKLRVELDGMFGETDEPA